MISHYRFLFRTILTSFLFASCSVSLVYGFSQETVFFDLPEALEPDPIPEPTLALLSLPGYPNLPGQLTLAARIYTPDANLAGPGPYPAVIILHGSGGLWSNDIIANGLVSQFKEWGEDLTGMGYLAIFPDSYNPRGIPGNFGNRRPHYNPELDDHLCSPNYERPKDVIATLAYLAGRGDVDPERVALMGFSHGAQTAMNAVLDVSVDLGQYTVSYIDLDTKDTPEPEDDVEFSTTKDVDSPVRIGDELPFPKVCVFYYGGGSHYGYHGSASDTGPGRYMFDRRTRVLLFHGTDDFLMGVDDPGVTPMTGTLFPIRQVLASSAQAAAIGVADPLAHHFIFDQVSHSFDLGPLALPQDWNTNAESPNQKAKRLGRDEVLKYFETYLKPPPDLAIALDSPHPGDVQITSTSTRSQSRYQWRWSDDLSQWNNLDAAFNGTGAAAQAETESLNSPRRFFRLEYTLLAPPFDDPVNDGFFRSYSDFDL